MSGQDHRGTEPVNARIFPLPPVVAGLFIAVGWTLNHFVPLGEAGTSVPFESRIAGALIIACALAIGFLALAEMRRVNTTYHPGGRANALASAGIYKRTRNPMYLSLTLITLGIGIETANPWMVLIAPLLLFYLQECVVKREEVYLTVRFGSDYEAYRSKVRRWF
jgi:protein-S-isoprenylcysteine O-methyltransferase Ste14